MMTVTCIIPVYNASVYLEKAVLSVLQFPEVKELLLIDDGSTDSSWQKCLELQERYAEVKALQHPDRKNHGVSATRNLGIDGATQEFITFLDADDYWLPNRLDAERELFKNPTIEGVFGGIDAEFIGEEGRKSYVAKFGETTLCTVQFPAEGMDVFLNLVSEPNTFGSFFSMIALTVRTESLKKNSLQINKELRLMEDKEFIIRLAYHCYLKTGIIDQPVAIRTAHENNSIMKLENNSKKFFLHNTKLYKSLYLWAKKINSFPKKERNFFKLKYLSSKVAAESGLKKYFDFFIYSIANPELLKTRYRYFALKSNR